MKALTLWQPWASLTMLDRPCDHPGEECIVEHPIDRPPSIKTIETRSWPAPKSIIGQRIAIHAAVADKPFRDLDAPSLSSQRTVIDAVLNALGVVEIDQEGREFWPSPWIEKGERICIGDITLPLGAIVGTAVLADCVPMVDQTPEDLTPYLLVCDDRLMLAAHPPYEVDVEHERPFGLYEQGRWAWVLHDARPLAEPIVCRGAQGLWNVPADVEERLR